MPDDYVPPTDAPVAGSPILLAPSTFARHAKAVDLIEGGNRAIYPRAPRGRTTRRSPGQWGYLAAGHTIAAASGMTLGEGIVKLCSRDHGTLTADGDDVRVLNSGSLIIGPKALELDWTDGEWAVCLCGTSAFCCFPCVIPKHDLKLGKPDGTGVQLTLTFTAPNGPWEWNDFPNPDIDRLDCSNGTLSWFHQDIGEDPGSYSFDFPFAQCNPFMLNNTGGATIYDPTPVDHDISACVVPCTPTNLPRHDINLGGYYGFATLFYHDGPPEYWETSCFLVPSGGGSSIMLRVFCDETNGASIKTSIYAAGDCTGTPAENTYGPPAASVFTPLHLDWDIGGGNHLFADYP